MDETLLPFGLNNNLVLRLSGNHSSATVRNVCVRFSPLPTATVFAVSIGQSHNSHIIFNYPTLANLQNKQHKDPHGGSQAHSNGNHFSHGAMFMFRICIMVLNSSRRNFIEFQETVVSVRCRFWTFQIVSGNGFNKWLFAYLIISPILFEKEHYQKTHLPRDISSSAVASIETLLFSC